MKKIYQKPQSQVDNVAIQSVLMSSGGPKMTVGGEGNGMQGDAPMRRLDIRYI